MRFLETSDTYAVKSIALHNVSKLSVEPNKRAINERSPLALTLKNFWALKKMMALCGMVAALIGPVPTLAGSPFMGEVVGLTSVTAIGLMGAVVGLTKGAAVGAVDWEEGSSGVVA
jgi:hypothetical protein